MAKRLLITGAGGFIGSHCVDYFLEKTDLEIIGIDSFRHKGDLGRLENINNKGRFKLYYHDLSLPISDQLINRITEANIDANGNIIRKGIDYIINMASDSAVERSTEDPTFVLRNNYDLAINMLEFARKVKPEKFIQISTDEIYGESFTETGHQEWDVVLPSNPYAASKAAQEAVCIAYWRTYNVPIVITNTMNIIGEWQDPEKFLPKIIQKIYSGETLPIYAESPEKIGSRVYIDVKNKADALLWLIRKPVSMYRDGSLRPDRWNICGTDEYNNLEFALLVAKIMGKECKYELVKSESARPGYDRRYMLDGSKLKNDGWVPPFSFEQSLKRIIDYFMANKHWII